MYVDLFLISVVIILNFYMIGQIYIIKKRNTVIEMSGLINIVIGSHYYFLNNKLMVNMQPDLKMNDIPENIPNDFKCPISKEIMHNPVIAFDGYSYEYEYIKRHLLTNDTSPMTNELMGNKLLIQNRNLRNRISIFVEK